MRLNDEHKQIVCGAIARTYNTLKPGEWVTDDAVIERTAAEVIARLTAALAAAPPVADAEVEDMCTALLDSFDIFGGTIERGGKRWLVNPDGPKAAALIRSLHARAVRAEAERDEARALLAEAKEALRPFAHAAEYFYGRDYADAKLSAAAANRARDVLARVEALREIPPRDKIKEIGDVHPV